MGAVTKKSEYVMLNQVDKQLEAKKQFDNTGFPTTDDENWLYWVPNANQKASLLSPFLSDVPVPNVKNSCDSIQIENGVLLDAIQSKSLDCYMTVDKFPAHEHSNYSVSSSSISSLVSQFVSQTIVIHVKESLPDPIVLNSTFNFMQKNMSGISKILVVVDEAAAATLDIHHHQDIDSSSCVNMSVEIISKSKASIAVHHIFQKASSLTFLSSTVHLYAKSKVSQLTYVNDSRLMRHDTDVLFHEEDSHATFSGVGLLKDKDLFFNHLTIQHQVPNCTCSQTFKNILYDEALVEFSGLVCVEPGAHGVDSTQMNKSLVFSDQARVLSRPQLKIDADDVQCAHGSTIGQLNPQELHYITSRGILLDEARAMLIYGFFDEVIRDTHSSLKHALAENIRTSIKY